MDIDLQFPPENIPLNTIFGVPVGIAKRCFLEALDAAELARLKLGRVVGPDGELCEEFVTFFSESVVHFRGNMDSTCQPCPVCNRPLFWPAGRRYVLARDVQSGSIWFSSFCTLLISQSVMDSFDRKRWKRITIEKVPVREEIMDPFPEVDPNKGPCPE